MKELDPSTYPPAIAGLVAIHYVAPLGPGTPVEEVRNALAAINDASFGRIANREMAAACRAGLWLAFNFLDESHTISQDLDTAEGSFWHAIMHRREPDPSNSKYWWRRVGNHPVFEQLSEEARSLGWKTWEPAAFVDACEKERGSGSEREALLCEIQRVEWELLFAWCSGRAKG